MVKRCPYAGLTGLTWCWGFIHPTIPTEPKGHAPVRSDPPHLISSTLMMPESFNVKDGSLDCLKWDGSQAKLVQSCHCKMLLVSTMRYSEYLYEEWNDQFSVLTRRLIYWSDQTDYQTMIIQLIHDDINASNRRWENGDISALIRSAWTLPWTLIVVFHGHSDQHNINLQYNHFFRD